MNHFHSKLYRTALSLPKRKFRKCISAVLLMGMKPNTS